MGAFSPPQFVRSIRIRKKRCIVSNKSAWHCTFYSKFQPRILPRCPPRARASAGARIAPGRRWEAPSAGAGACLEMAAGLRCAAGPRGLDRRRRWRRVCSVEFSEFDHGDPGPPGAALPRRCGRRRVVLQLRRHRHLWFVAQRLDRAGHRTRRQPLQSVRPPRPHKPTNVLQDGARFRFLRPRIVRSQRSGETRDARWTGGGREGGKGGGRGEGWSRPRVSLGRAPGASSTAAPGSSLRRGRGSEPAPPTAARRTAIGSRIHVRYARVAIWARLATPDRAVAANGRPRAGRKEGRRFHPRRPQAPLSCRSPHATDHPHHTSGQRRATRRFEGGRCGSGRSRFARQVAVRAREATDAGRAQQRHRTAGAAR